MGATVTDDLVDGLLGLGVPTGAALVKAKACVADFVGVTIGGSRELADRHARFLETAHAGKGEVPIIGLGRRASLQDAVFLNGLSSHVLELDDGARYGSYHPGSPVLPALLGVAFTERLTGADFLRGLVAGYEAGIRLAQALQPTHRQLGFHATGTCGAVGAAAAVATALRFTRDELKTSLSAAATSASGLLGVFDEASDLKPLNAARAALNGLQGAFMARVGYSGSRDLLGGDRGLLKALARDADGSCLRLQPGAPLALEGVYFKPYASCRHSHSAVEAALKLRESIGDFTQIRSVRVRTYSLGVPGHSHTQIHGVPSAKMSTPYAVASALVLGHCGMEAYTPEQVRDPRLTGLAAKVQVLSDDALSALVPKQRAAIVEIQMADGRTMEHRVDLPKGEPEVPMSESECRDKFMSLTRYGGMAPTEASRLWGHIQNIESELTPLLSLL
jgi:2-methylcitrate dehydratase PrpD